MSAVLVLLLVALTGFALIYVVVMATTSGAQSKEVEQKDEILDKTFDGSLQVMYSVTYVSLPAEVVLKGANERGYRLISDQKSTYGPRELTFERQD